MKPIVNFKHKRSYMEILNTKTRFDQTLLFKNVLSLYLFKQILFYIDDIIS